MLLLLQFFLVTPVREAWELIEIVSIVNPRQKSWLDNIIPTLDKPLFTVTVGENGDGKWNFGYIDVTQYKGNITYVPLDPRPSCDGFGLWMIPKFTVEWEGSKGSLVEKTCVAVGEFASPIPLSPSSDPYTILMKGTLNGDMWETKRSMQIPAPTNSYSARK